MVRAPTQIMSEAGMKLCPFQDILISCYSNRNKICFWTRTGYRSNDYKPSQRKNLSSPSWLAAFEGLTGAIQGMAGKFYGNSQPCHRKTDWLAMMVVRGKEDLVKIRETFPHCPPGVVLEKGSDTGKPHYAKWKETHQRSPTVGFIYMKLRIGKSIETESRSVAAMRCRVVEWLCIG